MTYLRCPPPPPPHFSSIPTFCPVLSCTTAQSSLLMTFASTPGNSRCQTILPPKNNQTWDASTVLRRNVMAQATLTVAEPT